MRTSIAFLLALFANTCIGQVTSPAPYCAAGYDDDVMPVPHYISNVTLGSLNNTTGTTQFPAPHYAYYNSLAAPALNQGSTYTLSVTHDGSASIHFVAAYIDFNHNNSFSDPGERVLSQTIATGGSISNPCVASLTIPATSATGVTRMRVMVFEDDNYTWASGNTTPVPCTADATGFLDWGETEDYNINITSTITCASVASVTVGSITSSGANISWPAVSGSIGYEYAVTTSATPPVSGTATTATSATPTGLTASTVYYAHVRNKCSSTSFSAWTTQTFTTLPATATCNPVTGLSASGITTVSANIAWTAPATTIGYEYVVNTSAADPSGSGTTITATSVTAPGLTPATIYYAHVRNKCGSTSYSAWSTIPFTTNAIPCDAVAGLALSGITITGASINWTAVGGAIGYEYVIDLLPGAPAGAGTTTPSTTVAASALSASTTYYVHVRTKCSGTVFSPWVTRAFTTASAPVCDPVTSIAITGITTTGATVSWLPVLGSAGYEYAVTASAIPPASSLSTTYTSVTFTALTPGVAYYAHVRNKCGSGAYSQWLSKPFNWKLGTGQVEIRNKTISIAPNPVTDYLSISIENFEPGALIQLVDISGRINEVIEIATNSLSLDMQKYPAGQYLLKYISPSHTEVQRITKR
jgi:hypothetical protein